MSDLPFINSEETSNLSMSIFTLPDGQQINVGNERFSIPELLFDPGPLEDKPDLESFTAYIQNSINSCPSDIRKEIKNTIICGGNSSINGFYERIQREMDLVTNPAIKMKVINSDEKDRCFLSWIGGSLLSTLTGFEDMWFSKREYKEHGAMYLDRKCP